MAACQSDEELNDLIYRATVPKGLRPTTPDETDAMLDAIGGEVPSEETVRRMLRKIRGEEPIGTGHPGDGVADAWPRTEEVNVPEESLALFRNQNEEIPPDVKEKLEAMEKRAMEESEEEEDHCDTDT